RDSTDTFASIDSARFAVAIWPLMFNRLVVDHVAVSGFKAWVIRDEHGRFNFRDLTRSPIATGLTGPALAVASTAVSNTAATASASGGEKSGPLAAAFALPLAAAAEQTERTDLQIDIAGL